MLVKEYRISLPMSVDEYRIAQLYMIQKKSREESEGTGSGVEILVNEEYEDGPGGSGQYTYKIYHIGSHLPGWFRAILPKSALRVEEKAWNAYPYTKTCYRCPFVEKFLIEIETIYANDGGEQQNVFNLSAAEKRQASVDYLDIVKDQISSGDYKQEEDPKLYQSIKTGRGPLNDNWRQEYSDACKAGTLGSGRAIMTAYKVCRVEFKYWGMQNKIERFIHDIALRKTMLRAHRQAWCWQDEWYGLTLADIRNLERETALALSEKMAAAMEEEGVDNDNENRTQSRGSNRRESIPFSGTPTNSMEPLGGSKTPDGSGSLINGRFETRGSHSALRPNMGSNRELANWRIESLEQLQESYSDSDEEFFDASEGEMEKEEEEEAIMMPRSTSMDMISSGDEYYVDARSMLSENFEESNFGRRVEHFRQIYSLDHGHTGSGDVTPPTSAVCPTKVLFIVLHGGSILDSSHETTSKRSDFATLRSTFDSVIQSHYQAAMGQIAFRLVSCPLICADTLSVLSSLSPFGLDCQSPNYESNLTMNQDFVPLGAISLFASSSLEYQEHVGTVITKVNSVYQEFLQSEDGRGFSGQICFLADSTGSLMAYDALARSTQQMRSRCGSHNSLENEDEVIKTINPESRIISQSDPDLPQVVGSKTSIKIERSKSEVAPPECELERPCFTRQCSGAHLNVNRTDLGASRRTSAGSYFDSNLQFDFDVSDLFMFGSPLAMVLAYRRLFTGDDKHSPPLRPSCHQVYNLFHSNDPTALRLEPLLHANFKHIEPIKIPRHSKFPCGDGESIHVVEAVQQCLTLFNDGHRQSISPGHPVGLLQRQSSSSSITSATSGVGETTVASITNVTSKWWGNKRVDYVLYCPEVLHSFPVSALPHLFHASFWESTDVVAFILRQILRLDVILDGDKSGRNNVHNFTITEPREKWLRRRTTIKVRNLQPNHRANDVIVLEDKPQVLTARFMYGSLDMTSLSGEKVDIHIMIQPASGEWIQLGTEITDNHGRLIYTIPEDKRLNQGMYPVKIVVKGDHTSVDFFLTVLPPKTETVVFSIDGAFTASVSIMGKDPKIRSGAVDVVRHWQELGYLILYVTARPDMQHRKVVTWLAQHNFPHGMVAFMDGISKDPLRQKLNYLKYLQAEANISYKAGYGSNKDIGIYKELGLSPSQIYVVGKASKKQHSQAQILSNGYAAHLYDLTSPGGSRPAVGNARIFLRKTCFRLPSLDTKRSARRTVSNTQSGGSDFLRPPDSGSTDKVSTSCGGRSLKDSFAAVRLRGKSPSTKSSS